MKIGLQTPRFSWPGSPQNLGTKLIEIAQTADQVGFSSLWAMDHFFQVGRGYGPPEDPMLDGYTTISFMAAVTQRINVGLMVTKNVHHHPGMLIKIVTSLDVLSGGRAYLGIGLGGDGRETKALGVPFPPTLSERYGRLEETLQIAKQMWQGDQSPFEGKYYHLEEPINNPQPLSQPAPPILIGGDGEKKTLRLVAKYGDACNIHLGTPLGGYSQHLQEIYQVRRERLTRKFNVLREHCEEVGRSYDEIERTVLSAIRIAPDAMSVTEVVELCHELAELGVQHVIFNMDNDYEIEPIEIIGQEVIPRLANLH